MKRGKNIENIYNQDNLSALEAQRHAYEIAFGPIVFQVSRLVCKFGILKLLQEHREGLDYNFLVKMTGLGKYAVQVLMESSLAIGTVKLDQDRFFLTKTGYFLQNDEQIKIYMKLNHDINYLGMFDLEQSLLTGKPIGLKKLGPWKTLYEGLSQMDSQTQKSWFAFDHYYSDHSFEEALKILFSNPIRKPCKILDIGGNTGRWAVQCVKYDPNVEITVLDIPGQIGILKEQVLQNPKVEGRERIHAMEMDILEKESRLPVGYDVIWMSQFLDCFSQENIVKILKKASNAMTPGSRLYIMELLWDRQNFQTAAFCLTQISLYFAAIANGESKMYHTQDLVQCIEEVGLKVEAIHDHLKGYHTILSVKKD